MRHHLGAGASAHFVNRLDRETSGLVVLAKDAAAARELGLLWARGQVEKRYLALVHGEVAADDGRIEAPLGRDTASRVAIKDCVRRDGAAALTDYTVLARHTLATARGPVPVTLLEVRPRTGRKHQIRIHLAHAGHPIVGDKLYGGCEDDYLALVEGRLDAGARDRLILPYHALHAASLAFRWRGTDFRFECPPDRPGFSGLPGLAGPRRAAPAQAR